LWRSLNSSRFSIWTLSEIEKIKNWTFCKLILFVSYKLTEDQSCFKFIKVRLTPNIIFGMCNNIWIIRRRNVMNLHSKKPHLGWLFHCQSSRYDVIRWIFGTKNKGKLICNSPNDIISGNFDSEKVDQDGIFYCKDILHFFFEWPKYTYCTKSHISG
jgi:hypothetical protein